MIRLVLSLLVLGLIVHTLLNLRGPEGGDGGENHQRHLERAIDADRQLQQATEQRVRRVEELLPPSDAGESQP